MDLSIIIGTVTCFIIVVSILSFNRQSLSNKYFRKFIIYNNVLIFLFLTRFISISVFINLLPLLKDIDENLEYYTYVQAIITCVALTTGTLRLMEPSVSRELLELFYKLRNKLKCKGNKLTKS